MADCSTGSSSSNEPYPLIYHYENDIFCFKELSDGSIQSAYAYHYDMTKIGRYFVEFEDGSILSTKNREPYVPLKPTDEYFRLEETPANSLWADFLWEESFPLLKVGAGENAENNNVGQVFDTSTQRATHTFQGNTMCSFWLQFTSVSKRMFLYFLVTLVFLVHDQKIQNVFFRVS